MKKTKTCLYSTFFLLLAYTLSAQEPVNGQYPFTRERSIHKSYPAKGSSLHINNKFGEVKIIVWDKNEIKVDVQLIGSATEQERADAMFDAIHVTDSLSAGAVYFTTFNTQVKGKDCSTCKSSWAINYTIHLPAVTDLSVKNSFGQIYVPDYTGNLTLENSYGGIDAGNLANLKSMTVAFGKVQMKSIQNATAFCKWSSVEIDRLSGNNTLSFEHCRSVVIGAGKDVTLLGITETFSTVDLKVDKNLSAEYFIESNNGMFKNNSSVLIIPADEASKNTDSRNKKYKGKNGNGSSKVTIKSNFGTVLLDD